jgi:hypothetical protein
MENMVIKQTEAVAMEWLWEINRKELDDKIAIAKTHEFYCTTYHSTQYSTFLLMEN